MKYKFSWSPRGVLSAALNGAKFKLGGKASYYNSLLEGYIPYLLMLFVRFKRFPARISSKKGSLTCRSRMF